MVIKACKMLISKVYIYSDYDFLNGLLEPHHWSLSQVE